MEVQGILKSFYEHFVTRDLTYIFGGFLVLLVLNYSFKNADVFSYLFINLGIDERMEWLKLIIIFIVSYFVGILIKESLTNDRYLDAKLDRHLKENSVWTEKEREGLEKWFSTNVRYFLYKKDKKYDRYEFFYYLAEIQKAYKGSDIINRLERVLYFLHIGVSIGISSLVCCFILASALIVNLINHLINYFNIELPLWICFPETIYGNCSYLVPLIIMCFTCYFCWRENIWKMDEYINFFNKTYNLRKWINK